MKKCIHSLSARTSALSAVLSPVLVLALALSSCAVENEAVKIWGESSRPPSFISLEVDGANCLRASFTAPVSVLESSVLLSGPDGEESRSTRAEWSTGGGGAPEQEIVFLLEEPPPVGEKAFLVASVSDSSGNTLSMSVPFTGYNADPAVLRINEVRTSYSKPKVEFIEFLVMKGGNLGGIEIENAANTVKPVWEFPACEVEAGEYVVYHLRSIEDGLVDETSAGITSAGTEARQEARDFWDVQTKAPLKSTNVIAVRERKGGVLQDAFLCAADGISSWPTEALAKAASEAFESGLWVPGSAPGDAFSSTGMTATRTAGRKNEDASAVEDDPQASSADFWRICPTGKASPGAANAAWAEQS